MSTQALHEFLSQVAADTALQDELRTVGVGGGDVIKAEKLVEFATGKGFDVTLDDVRGASLELSEAELESVAGGAISGVEGEATDKDHERWTDILSFNQVISYKAP